MTDRNRVTEIFKKDYYRMTGERWGRSPRTLKNMLFMHNLRYVKALRKAQNGSKPARVRLYRLSRKFGLEISPAAKIGAGLYLGHPYNITIGGVQRLVVT